MILAHAGFMKLFKVYYPGSAWAHDYTRLQVPTRLGSALKWDFASQALEQALPVLDDPLHGPFINPSNRDSLVADARPPRC